MRVREGGGAAALCWQMTLSSQGNSVPARPLSSFVLFPVGETGRSIPPAASEAHYFHLSACNKIALFVREKDKDERKLG